MVGLTYREQLAETTRHQWVIYVIGMVALVAGLVTLPSIAAGAPASLIGFAYISALAALMHFALRRT